MDENGTFRFVYEDFGKYSTDILTDRAVQVVQNYSKSEQPLFMYLAYQAIHSANEAEPLQVTLEYKQQLTHTQIQEKRNEYFIIVICL